MEREHTIYLFSTGSLDIYPDNKPCRFTNRLARPIILDANNDYEIGLVSTLYPNDYYALSAYKEKYNIIFSTKIKSFDEEHSKYTSTVKTNIPAGDMENLLFSLNEEVKFTPMHYYNTSYGKVFQNC